MSLQSPLGKARGLGSAKEGLHHWWMQRVTAVALIPLTIWFAYSVACIAGTEYNAVLEKISSPLNSILLVCFIIAAFYHAALGLQVVFEDYVSTKAVRIICIVSTNLLLFFLAIAGIFAVVRISLGGQ